MLLAPWASSRSGRRGRTCPAPERGAPQCHKKLLDFVAHKPQQEPIDHQMLSVEHHPWSANRQLPLINRQPLQ